MLRSVKMTTQVLAGSGLMLAILAALGAIGYATISRVESGLTRVADHRLAATKGFREIERLASEAIFDEPTASATPHQADYVEARRAEALFDKIEALASETQSCEREYRLSKELKHFAAIQQKTGELLTCCDELARLQRDEVEQRRIAEMRKAIQEHLAKVQAWGTLQRTTLEGAVEANAGVVAREAAAFVAAKKTEHSEAKNALTMLNRFNALALGVQASVKGYVLDLERKRKIHESIMEPLHRFSRELSWFAGTPFEVPGDLEPSRQSGSSRIPYSQDLALEVRGAGPGENLSDKIAKNVADLVKCCDELAGLHADATERRQVAEIRMAAQAYVEGAKQWAAEQKKDADSRQLVELAKAMNDSGSRVSKAVESYLKTKEAQVNQAANAVFLAAEIAVGIGNVDLTGRSSAVSQEPTPWAAVNRRIVNLRELCEDVYKLSPVQIAVEIGLAQVSQRSPLLMQKPKPWAAASDRIARLVTRCDQLCRTSPAQIAAAIGVAGVEPKSCTVPREPRLSPEVVNHIAKLSNLCDELRRVSPGQADQARLAKIDRGIKHYQASARSWITNDASVSSVAESVRAECERIVKALAAIEGSHRAKVDKLAQSVFSARAAEEHDNKLRRQTLLAMAQVARQSARKTCDDGAAELGEIAAASKSIIAVALAAGLVTVVLFGAFLASGIRELVAGHVAVHKKAAACLAAFGRGYFDTRVERLPGEQGCLNDAIESLRASLKSVTADVRTLAAAAASGALETRAVAGKHAGAWGEIIQGMNQALESVEAPVRHLDQVLGRAARKDFAATVDRSYPGAFGDLCGSVNLVLANIRSAVEEISESAALYSDARRAIAEDSEMLNAALKVHNHSVDEMAISLRGVARWIQSVKQNADLAAQVAKEAGELAEAGKLAIQDSEQWMSRIRNRTRQIHGALQTISEIPDPTNAEALKAALGAARAGEHGTALAVVRAEARKLARQSDSMTPAISPLLTESEPKHGEGGLNVDSTPLHRTDKAA